MGRDHSEKKRSEDRIKEKDTEIEELKTAQQAYITRIKELEAKVASLEYSRMSTDSEDTEPPTPIFKLPELPLSLRERKQPTSVFANLPALPVFTGFDTPDEGAALTNPLFSPEASPEGFPPRSSALFSSTKSTLEPTMPSNLPVPLETRPKGAVPRHPPHHQSSRGVPGTPPPTTASTLSRNPGTRNLSLRDSSKEVPVQEPSPAKR